MVARNTSTVRKSANAKTTKILEVADFANNENLRFIHSKIVMKKTVKEYFSSAIMGLISIAAIILGSFIIHDLIIALCIFILG